MGRTQFQSTRPIRGATLQGRRYHPRHMDFNPRAPYGARRNIRCERVELVEFQSTRPIRGATPRCPGACPWPPYFNPRAPYGARHGQKLDKLKVSDFNPRAPYGARRSHGSQSFPKISISIHAPHTGRDGHQITSLSQFIISIHAPHTGRDDSESYVAAEVLAFQSTRPIRGATVPAFAVSAVPDISIHAPHTGRDYMATPARLPSVRYFNPRAPYGARLLRPAILGGLPVFQSTRPIRGATNYVSVWPGSLCISIHAPHTGRDCFCLYCQY